MKMGYSLSFGILLAASALLGCSIQESGYTIRVRVFEIPMIQTVGWGGGDGKGGIRGGQVGGNVTASFPDGLVVIPTDLGDEASSSIIKATIRKNVEFGCAKEFPQGIDIQLIDDYDLYFGEQKAGEIKDSHIIPYGGRQKKEYRLQVTPIMATADEAVVSIQFCIREIGSTATGSGTCLFKQTFGLGFSKLLLVGYPLKDAKPRGTVQWLALLAKKTT